MTSRDFVLLALQLATMLAFAIVFGQVMRRFRQPAVLGEMIGGIVLGPTLLGTIAPSFYDWLFHSSANASLVRDASVKIGMLFFLFIAGLEINLSDLRSAGRKVLLIGLVGTLLPIGVGIGMVYALPRGFWGDVVNEHFFAFAVFIGMNLANSANPVLARILMDLGLLKDEVGSLAMAATIVDDLINWALFAVVLAEVAPSSGMVSPDSLPISVGLVLLLFVVILGGGRRVAPAALRWVKSRVSWPSGFIAVMALMILLAASASEGLGVHAFLGAFLVGAALSGRDDEHEEARAVITHSSLSFFAPIYFLSLGMTTDFIAGFDLGLVLVILVAAIVSKLAGVLIGARLAGMPLDNRTWAVAWGLNARGATGIILAGVGRSAGVIDDRIFVAVVVMALITSLLAGPMMGWLLGRPKPARLEGRSRPIGQSNQTTPIGLGSPKYVPPMHPGIHAAERPDHPALIMAGSGETVTYRELDERAARLGQLLRARGLNTGDRVAILMDNRPEFFEVLWAAIRSGLYLTTINRFLTVEEAAYILEDCEAKALVTASSMSAVAGPLAERVPGCTTRLALAVDGAGASDVDGFEDYRSAIAEHPAEPIADAERGDIMLYSSGTTGRPKGIKRPLSGESLDKPPPLIGMLALLFGFDADTVYLSPAPLYHTAPLGYSMGVQIQGGTVVCMEHFDAVEALGAIERHHVTHSQWVPTMFVRMLKLTEEERRRHDLTSHRVAIHAAAPCPVAVKQQMFEWWGPIIHEYYGGTEGNGVTYAGPEDWLAHPGTVGRPIFGTIHVCDDDGNELPAGEDGIVYFEQPARPFEYHNDPEKTRSTSHPEHESWTALGDIGHVDEDGFLYLTDRKHFMIISAGVNIYPQEIEDCLVMHPKVTDVAVIGVPDDEMGESVKAIVQVEPGVDPSPEVAEELRTYAREHLAGYKVPRTVDFIDELPRLPTGKLYKRVLVEQYR